MREPAFSVDLTAAAADDLWDVYNRAATGLAESARSDVIHHRWKRLEELARRELTGRGLFGDRPER
jgi:hypothetical protein